MDVPAPSCDGVIWGQANLNKDWVGVNVRDAFAKSIGKKKVFMTNDGSAAAYGEFALRRRKIKGMLFCAPGTGLAGGLILENGDIYEGCNGLALEIGHVSSPFREDGKLPKCGCGKEGCVEANVSLVALRRQLAAKLKLAKHKNHPLNKENASASRAKAFKLRDLADAGDRLALELFDHQGFVLGYALGDQAHELNPEVIVVGGGLSEAGFRETFMDSIKRGYAETRTALLPEEPAETARADHHFRMGDRRRRRCSTRCRAEGARRLLVAGDFQSPRVRWVLRGDGKSPLRTKNESRVV